MKRKISNMITALVVLFVITLAATYSLLRILVLVSVGSEPKWYYWVILFVPIVIYVAFFLPKFNRNVVYVLKWILLTTAIFVFMVLMANFFYYSL